MTEHRREAVPPPQGVGPQADTDRPGHHGQTQDEQRLGDDEAKPDPGANGLEPFDQRPERGENQGGQGRDDQGPEGDAEPWASTISPRA